MLVVEVFAMRLLLILTLVPFGLTPAIAAPVPKDTRAGKLARLYGKTHDPNNHAQFELDGDDLVVKMSADLSASAVSLKGSPRTGQEIRGDFEAVVAVKYASEKNPATDKLGGHLGGGLTLWETEESWFLINRHHWPAIGSMNGSDWSGGFDVHGTTMHTVTSQGATCAEVPLDKPTLLKLTRTGRKIVSAESRDGGKTWNRLTESNHDFADHVNVGVCVFNTTSAKGTVTFSGFSVVTPLRK